MLVASKLELVNGQAVFHQAARNLGLTRPGLYKVLDRLGLARGPVLEESP